MPAHPYDRLTPEMILAAVESIGLRCDGRLLALNSYENRVYQVGIEDETPIVAKFYRPDRWTDLAIGEEHQFCHDLSAAEIPVVAPIADEHGTTLHRWETFRFALYPRRGGHWPELDRPGTLTRLGRFLGRIHAIGAGRRFKHRSTLSIETHGHASRELLLASDYIPTALRQEYADISAEMLAAVERRFQLAQPLSMLAIHGDFHPGNVLWTDHGAHLVDFDDCMNGPVIQDLWMLLSGDNVQMQAQLSELLLGYEDFASFDWRQIHLIEALRALRLIHYSAWLARRWEDPTFPRYFPWFGEKGYWQEQIATFRNQLVRLGERDEPTEDDYDEI